MRIFRLHRTSLILIACLASSGTTRAEDKPFTATLSEAEQKAVGLNKLKPEQISTLNNLVQREIILAKQGDAVGFAADFTLRRSAPELAKAGIDKLTPTERARLDADVAQAIATRPQDFSHVSSAARTQTSVPVQAFGPKLEIHGSVSFTVGAGSGGRSFYGGTVEVEQTDPAKGYTIAVAYSEFHGKGMWGPYGPYGYGYGYGCGPGSIYGPGWRY